MIAACSKRILPKQILLKNTNLKSKSCGQQTKQVSKYLTVFTSIRYLVMLQT